MTRTRRTAVAIAASFALLVAVAGGSYAATIASAAGVGAAGEFDLCVASNLTLSAIATGRACPAGRVKVRTSTLGHVTGAAGGDLAGSYPNPTVKVIERGTPRSLDTATVVSPILHDPWANFTVTQGDSHINTWIVLHNTSSTAHLSVTGIYGALGLTTPGSFTQDLAPGASVNLPSNAALATYFDVLATSIGATAASAHSTRLTCAFATNSATSVNAFNCVATH